MWFINMIAAAICAWIFLGSLKVALKTLHDGNGETGVGIIAVCVMMITGIAFGSLIG